MLIFNLSNGNVQFNFDNLITKNIRLKQVKHAQLMQMCMRLNMCRNIYILIMTFRTCKIIYTLVPLRCFENSLKNADKQSLL